MGDKAKGDIVKTQETEHQMSSTDNQAVDQEAIAILAYFYWEVRGCPHDSPHEDWFRAEADLRKRLTTAAAA
jgi:hypothetical protein